MNFNNNNNNKNLTILSSIVVFVFLAKMIENWKNETNKLTLFENLRLYCKIFYEERQIDDYRWEKLDFLKKIIKKMLPTFIISSNIWFYAVEKYEMFNASYFQEDEFYFESLIRWREKNADDFIRRNSRFFEKRRRRRKKPFRKPIRKTIRF